MKKSTSLIAGILFVGVSFIYRTSGDQSWMEAVHRKVDRSVACEKTENLHDRTWMACRFPGRSAAGTVWVLLNENDDEVWIARNAPAGDVAERFNQLPREDKAGLLRVYKPSVQDNIHYGLNRLPAAPWDQLK